MALVDKSVMAEGFVQRHKEETLARHGTVFHGKTQEPGPGGVLVTVAKAYSSLFGKLDHLRQFLALVAHAEGAQEAERKSGKAANLLDGRKLAGVVDGVVGTFVKTTVESTTTHGIYAILEVVDVVTKRFLKVQSKAEKGRKRKSPTGIKDGRVGQIFLDPLAVGKVHGGRSFKFPVYKRANILENNLIHGHGLRPKGKVLPCGRQRHLSPGSR